MSSQDYRLQAKFLIERGYVSSNTNIDSLVDKLIEQDKSNKPIPEKTLTTERVYGKETTKIIKKMTEAKPDGEKDLQRLPFEDI